MEEIRDAVERKIAEAVARGEFDNLPLQGKPLNLSVDPNVPPEWRMAFKILKDNKVVPEFVERRKNIETLRGEMGKAGGEHAFRKQAEKLAAEIEALNRCLARENQFVRGSLQMAPVDVEAEVKIFLLGDRSIP